MGYPSRLEPDDGAGGGDLDDKSAERMALEDLGLALRDGDIQLALRIQSWLVRRDHHGVLTHEELREAYCWPQRVKQSSPSERGRRGGLAVLEKYGPEHFAAITNGRKPRPRHTSPREVAGQADGASDAHITARKPEGGDATN